MSRNISSLRESLFDSLDLLKKGELSVEQAKAISEMSQVIINSAKVEVDYIKANNGGETPFLESIGDDNLPAGISGRTIHRIK
ncbi:MAG: hypothetical protein H5U29_00030 [Pusillimonas sp.]|nr:hypothetical protein [Pusillimonas sp.]